MSKKVWILICEGDTDREFITHYHNSINSKRVKVEIYGGDFLTDWDNKITNKNLPDKISELFSETIIRLVRTKRIKEHDIEKLIYVTDTDKCFEDNDQKGNLLYKLSQMEKLEIEDIKFDFQLMIFSNDLEHVTSNTEGSVLNVDEKYELIDSFCLNYINKDDIDSYFIENSIYVYQKYSDFIYNPYRLQGRSTNLNTIYSDIE